MSHCLHCLAVSLSHCPPYYLPSTSVKDKRIQRALAASGPAMRSRLAKRLNMRFTPELRFVQSRAEEHMEEMNLLFDAIAEERRNYPEPEPVASQTAAPARRRVGRRRAAAQRHTDDTVDNE